MGLLCACGLIGGEKEASGQQCREPGRLQNPVDISVDSQGILYVAAPGLGSGGIYAPGVFTVDPEGAVSYASGWLTGVAVWHLATGPSGEIYYGDSFRIFKVERGRPGVRLAGNDHEGGAVDGCGTNARLYGPSGMVVDASGTLYFADLGSDLVRTVDPAGCVSTLAGAAFQEGIVDGVGSSARFGFGGRNLAALALDGAGNVFVAEGYSYVVRKMTPGREVTTVRDAGGNPVRFKRPSGIAVDSSGNVFVSESDGNDIKKIAPGGAITTFAGSPGQTGSADGTGEQARFCFPSGLAIDRGDNLYVADSYNHAIRRITPAGVVTTLAH